MKRIMLFTALAVSLGLFAQQGPRYEKGPEGAKKGLMHDLSPEEQATLKTKKMTLTLDLTEAQQNKIYQIHLQNAKERQSKLEDMKKNRDSGEWTKPSKEDRFNEMNARLDKQIAHKKEMKAILNNDQFIKWERGAIQRGKMKKENRKQRSRPSRE